MVVRNGAAKNSVLKRFLRDSAGTVAMIAGLSAIPLLVAAGVAVDMARASHEQQALQVALDSAALAVGATERSQVQGLTEVQLQGRYDELKVLAKKYIDQNYQTQFGDTTQIDLDIEIPENGTIILDARHDFPTTIMQLVGIDEMEVNARAQVEKRKIPNPAVEIALVLDTTGSMIQPASKLADAKQAAKDLLDIVFDGAATSPYIKVALVPFAQTVNIGADKAGSGWIDTGGVADYSNDNFTNTARHNWWAWQQLNNRPWTGCVEARKGTLDTNDTPPSVANPDTLFTPWFAPDEPSNNSDYTNNWRNTNETSGLTQPYTADKRQRNHNKYPNAQPSTANLTGPWHGCKGTAPIIPLTNVKATVYDAIDGLTADNYTHVNQGAIWGWRVLSPGAPFTEGTAYDDDGWKKIMILMTDGENTYPIDGNSYDTHNGSEYSAYGHLAQGKLGTTSYSTAISRLNVIAHPPVALKFSVARWFGM